MHLTNILLLICGDIEPNPGPTGKKFIAQMIDLLRKDLLEELKEIKASVCGDVATIKTETGDIKRKCCDLETILRKRVKGNKRHRKLNTSRETTEDVFAEDTDGRHSGSSKFSFNDASRIQRMPIYGAPVDLDNILQATPTSVPTMTGTSNRIFRPIPLDMTLLDTAPRTYPRSNQKKGKRRKKIPNHAKKNADNETFDSREGGDGTSSSDADAENSDTNNNNVKADKNKRRATIDVFSAAAFTNSNNKESSHRSSKKRVPLSNSVREVPKNQDSRKLADTAVEFEWNAQSNEHKKLHRVDSLIKAKSEPRLARLSYVQIPIDTGKQGDMITNRFRLGDDQEKNERLHAVHTRHKSEGNIHSNFIMRKSENPAYETVRLNSIDNSSKPAVNYTISDGQLYPYPDYDVPVRQITQTYPFENARDPPRTQLKANTEVSIENNAAVWNNSTIDQMHVQDSSPSGEHSVFIYDDDVTAKRNVKHRAPTPPPKKTHSSLTPSPVHLHKQNSVDGHYASISLHSPTSHYSYVQDLFNSSFNSEERGLPPPPLPPPPPFPPPPPPLVMEDTLDVTLDPFKPPLVTKTPPKTVQKSTLDSLHEEIKQKLKQRSRSIEELDHSSKQVNKSETIENIENFDILRANDDDDYYTNASSRPIQGSQTSQTPDVFEKHESNNVSYKNRYEKHKFARTMSDNAVSKNSLNNTGKIIQSPLRKANSVSEYIVTKDVPNSPYSYARNYEHEDASAMAIPAPDYENSEDKFSNVISKQRGAHRFLGRALKSVNRDECPAARRFSVDTRDNSNALRNKTVQFTKEPPDIIPNSHMKKSNDSVI